MRPVEVAKKLGMKVSTVYKYYQQWKRLGPNFEKKYAFIKSLLKKNAPDRDRNLELFARTCGTTKEEFEAVLAKPHGLRRLMTGRLYFPAHEDADRKRQAVLEVALLIHDHLIKNGGAIDDVRFTLESLMNQRKQYRKWEDARIEEENKDIALIRQVLKAIIEAEQQKRPKREKLSDEERNAILRFGLESKMKDLEKTYWIRVAELKGKGLTEEQARKKIYQDLLDTGDLKGARMMRAYQDMIHPLKGNSQEPPTSPPQPPSS